MMLSTAIGSSPTMAKAEINAAAESTRLKRELKVFNNELIIYFQPFRSIDNLTSHKNCFEFMLVFYPQERFCIDRHRNSILMAMIL